MSTSPDISGEAAITSPDPCPDRETMLPVCSSRPIFMPFNSTVRVPAMATPARHKTNNDGTTLRILFVMTVSPFFDKISLSNIKLLPEPLLLFGKSSFILKNHVFSLRFFKTRFFRERLPYLEYE